MPGAAAGAQGYSRFGEQRAGVAEVGDVEALHTSGPRRQPLDLISTPGNIRVLCRLRPGTPSSLVSLEPGPGGTVTTCYRGHQRRFRLDWVFPPHASQEEVMLHPWICVDCLSDTLESSGGSCLSALLGERVAGLQQGRERSRGAWEQGWHPSWAPAFLPGFFLCIWPPSSCRPGKTNYGLKED